MGNSINYLHEAIEKINKHGGVVTQQSAIYKTAAWGNINQPDFLNQALALGTTLSPQILLQTILEIEKSLGRIRDVKMGPRTIDIDILLYADMVVDNPELQIPHPRMQQRRFVLLPLCDIAATIIHPIKKIAIQQMLANCTDDLEVNKL